MTTLPPQTAAGVPPQTAAAVSWRLSPSDFSFLWEDCKRCFYLKVVRGLWPARGPMPAMFSKIAAMQEQFFNGKRTEELAPALPPGTFSYGERRVRSADIVLPGRAGRCYVLGRFDTVIQFDDGTYGVVDFKTSETKEAHRSNYSRQLHAYTYALEHPAPYSLALSPVRIMGLLCLDVIQFGQGQQRKDLFYLRCHPAWIPFERDDAAFMAFLGKVLDVLELPAPPPASETCRACIHRSKARALGKELGVEL